jgi:hypothetical protein
MARLASIEKAGYFPCPTNVVETLVLRHIRLHPWAPAPTYILDPCAGEGSAVHTFAQALASLPTSTMAAHYADMAQQCQRRIHVRAVELDAERARAAKALLGEQNVLHAAIEGVSAVGQFGIVWLNPPYDQVSGGRAELAWLRMCAPFVGESGMLVLIVPDMFVGTGRYAREMTSALLQAGFGSSLVLRFPDPEYEPFKQVAILASRPVSSNNYAYRNIDLAVAGVIGQSSRTHTHIIRAYDTTPTLTRVLRAEPRPSVFEAEHPAAVMDLLGDPTGNSSALRPLAPMRSEHAAMVAAAGMFNGAVVGDKVIKGTTIKRVLKTTKHSETEAGTQVTEEIEAEVLAAQLATIDMRTAAIEVVNSMDHKERFEALLEAHAVEFVDLAKRLYPPVFTPEKMGRYEEALGHIHAPRVIKGQQNGMFPPQAFRAGAILDGWRRHKVVTMVGEMGVGKTLCAMAACTVKALQRKPHNQKIVVLLPPKEDLVKKWAEEIRTALREYQPYVVHAQTISDVQAAFARDGLVFVLLKETTAKMSSGWAPVEPIRPRQRRKPKPGAILTGVRPPRCPACGQPILYDVDDPGKIKAHCQHCGTPMWTATRRKNGNGNGNGPGYARYPLARFIRDRYRDRYLLIIDEAHGFKSGDSARSYAAQDLLASSHCALQMTGTLYNGMASSIYYLLWRALPEFRAAWGWSDVQRFINQYGLFEKITRTYRDKHSTSASGYENFTERKSERPGIHPAMIALLLPSTVFFGIRDLRSTPEGEARSGLDIILPPYAEHTLFVPRPPELQAVECYLDAAKSDAVARMMDGDYRLMAQWSWANLGAWDVASLGDEVDGHTLAPVVCPGDMWLKEEALLRLIAREKRTGRKVLCFVGQINRRDPTGRLCALLERYGMRGAVMRANEKQRVQFIRRALAGGADVVFTSAQLVKEGIDLLELPTLVWYAAEYNIYLVQQANRRSWRIGQTEDVHVYYLAYDRTPQAYAMHRIAKKLAAAQTLQGDVRQGLAALLGEEDFVSRLQDATIHTEHYESELALDDLPPLVSFALEVDVQVTVQTSRPARVRVTVQVEDLRQFQQLSLFG